MKNLLIALLFIALAARADDEKFPLLKIGSDTYTNVVVTSHNATDIYFIHAGGAANAKIKKLSPELQQQFDYDPKQAAVAEQKLADHKNQFHQQVLHQSVGGGATEAVWREDFPGALQQAKAEKKFLLLDFTGSDWCPWCIKFDHDVLSTPQFAAYAARKLELVRLDFPRHSMIAEALRHANADLEKQFSVDGFPTFILLNGDGKELCRQVGYLNGGPDAFIALLEKFSR
jgi:thioredoxin-related protein